MSTQAVIPAPPPGFVPLEQSQQTANALPPPPPGFVPLEKAAAAEEKPGPFTRFMQSLLDNTVGTHTNEGVIEGVTKGLPYIAKHPIDSVKLIGGAMVGAHEEAANSAIEQTKQPGIENKIVGGVRYLQSGIPIVGPMLDQAGQKFQKGDVAGGLGATTGIAALTHGGNPEVRANAAEMITAPVRKVGDVGRGALAERMQQKAPGSQFTRGEVLQAAKDAGINLDVAQATDHPVARVVKKVNENSLTGNSTYEANRAANQGALENLADTEKGKYAAVSADREVVGGQIQDALRKDLVGKKAAATEAFEDLDKRVGSNTIDATNTVEAQARQIVAENRGYYAKHPELIPKQAWSIVENLAKREKVTTVNPSATAPGLMDANGAPINATGTFTQAPSKANFMKWSELHQLRSDLMDIYRNNPDIVKGQSERWLQTMVGTIDKAMTDSAGGLKGSDLAQFRAANANWESIKGTYDNPQSPLYQAIRTPYQSQVGSMLSRATPELARQVRRTLGSVEGPFQRQFVEQIINSKDGTTPDFKNLAMKLRRIPTDHLEAMIGKDGAKNLRMLGELAQKVTSDANPSGTAKVGQPAAEAAAAIFHPATGMPELVAQYGTAKAMNSPRVIEYLTSPATKAMLERSGWMRDPATGRWVRK